MSGEVGKPYGLVVAVNQRWNPIRSCVSIDRSPNGNLILRVGRENEEHDSWYQTEHVVMQPEEAREFIAEIERMVLK